MIKKTVEGYKIMRTYPSLDKSFKVHDLLVKREITAMTLNIITYTVIGIGSRNTPFISQKEVEENPDFFRKVTIGITIEEI